MKRNAVNFVVDNTTTMHTVDRHVTRFALAKGVVDELILDFGKKNTHTTVTLLRAVPVGGRYAYLYSDTFDFGMVHSPPNTSIAFSSNLMDRVIPTPTSDLTISHTLFFTDGENFDAATRKAFETGLRSTAATGCANFDVFQALLLGSSTCRPPYRMIPSWANATLICRQHHGGRDFGGSFGHKHHLGESRLW